MRYERVMDWAGCWSDRYLSKTFIRHIARFSPLSPGQPGPKPFPAEGLSRAAEATPEPLQVRGVRARVWLFWSREPVCEPVSPSDCASLWPEPGVQVATDPIRERTAWRR